MTHELPHVPVQEWLARLNDSARDVCLFTGNGEGWGTYLAWNPSETFAYHRGGRQDISELTRFVERQAAEGRKIMGYLSYDLGYELFGLRQTAADDIGLPDIRFLAFDNYLEITADTTTAYFQREAFLEEIQRLRPSTLPAAVRLEKSFRPMLNRVDYDNAFDKIKRYIVAGDVYQVNLTHRLEALTDTPARAVFCQILDRVEAGFMAYMEGDGFALHSASPERFIRTRGNLIDTFPIKGTRPRGMNERGDKQLQAELLASAKEAAELNMITDLLRNDLGKVSKSGSVEVRGERLLQLGQRVMHTYSHVSGQLRPDVRPIEALLSMFPGGSITGCPKKRAMEIIDELEPVTRSVYCGSFVMIEPDGSLDSNIAIRTVIQKGDSLLLSVGGGIVNASDQAAEYQETLDKAQALVRALAPDSF